MATLGPIGSNQDSISPSNVFYVDLSDRLADDETISSVVVTTDDDGLTISSEAATTSAITLDNGDTVSAGQAVQFRITTSEEQELDATIDVAYETSDSNADVYSVNLSVVKKVT